jgi:hypothetical protein
MAARQSKGPVHAILDEGRIKALRKLIVGTGKRRPCKDAVVLVVGGGAGLLSLFACTAGASSVFVVEESVEMVVLSQQIALANNCSDTIQTLQGTVASNAMLLPMVDVIICADLSPWNARRSLLPDVLLARDRHLRPGGVLLPDRCCLMIACCRNSLLWEERVGWWADCYGYDFSCMRELAVAEGIPSNIGKEELMSKPVKICDLNLYTLPTLATDKELLKTKMTFEMVRGGPWDSFCAWDRLSSAQARWDFDGSPAVKSLHWRQVRLNISSL